MAQDLVAFVNCENIIEDKSNRISLINIFDVIDVPGVPGVFPSQIFISFFAPEGTHKLKIMGISPSKMETEIFASQEFVCETREKRIVIIPTVIQVIEFGEYQFNAYLDDQILGTSYFLIRGAKA